MTFFISPFINRTEKASFKYVKVFFKQTVLLKFFMTGPSVHFFGNQNMVTLLKYKTYLELIISFSLLHNFIYFALHICVFSVYLQYKK